ncbi:hypothetical protein [Nocardia carnea]|uniref:hypothetical protein n=1 Tax=Nocardia carnea TaxID=37328 RepID=UPI002458680F|nr:hypothetical protein [Nocardia carnea]
MRVVPGELSHCDLWSVMPAPHAIARAQEHVLKYRLVVVSRTVRAAAGLAGGWLFDRAMSGWDVTVLAEDVADPLPARVLGAFVVPWDSVPASADGPDPQAVAIIGNPQDFDERMRRWVTDYSHRGQETTLWGEDARLGPHLHTEPAKFRPSRTALLFKSHALNETAGPPAALPAEEYFRAVGPVAQGVTHLRPHRQSDGSRWAAGPGA